MLHPSPAGRFAQPRQLAGPVPQDDGQVSWHPHCLGIQPPTRAWGASLRSMANRLANETSPYLLQHRDNPVDWYPWGHEALERARSEDRPILLSIGYSACHWCHVMERESFEDPDTAALHERALRLHQGRPRGAARRRRDLHGGGPGHDRPRRLAADRVPRPRRGAVLRRHLLPARAAPGNAELADGDGGRGRVVEHPARARSAASTARIREQLERDRPASSRPRGAEPEPILDARGRAGCERRPTCADGGFGGAPKFPPPRARAAAGPRESPTWSS